MESSRIRYPGYEQLQSGGFREKVVLKYINIGGLGNIVLYYLFFLIFPLNDINHDLLGKTA